MTDTEPVLRFDIAPQPPFLWPEPRVLAGMAAYPYEPPFETLLLRAQAVVAVIAAPAAHTVEAIRGWMQMSSSLRVQLLIAVYPTCAARREHLDSLSELARQYAPRLNVRVRAFARVTSRPTSVVCFEHPDNGQLCVASTASEDLGGDTDPQGKINFVFRASPGLIAGLKNEIAYQWAAALPIEDDRARDIPALVLPEGTAEGERLWREYRSSWDEPDPAAVRIDSVTGEVTMLGSDGETEPSPFDAAGLASPDALGIAVADLYERGSLVSIDKQSRVPPLDAPIHPKLLGEDAERQAGGITRRVSVRVSVFSEQNLKEFQKHRKAIRSLLDRFTFGLADGMRWMPHQARRLFDAERIRMEEQGHDLLGKLVQGPVDAFLHAKRAQLSTDIQRLLTELGRTQWVDEVLLQAVMESLKARIEKSRTNSIAPTLTYSPIGFSIRSGGGSDPWGQVSSLLSDIVEWPRRLLTSPFFLRGLVTPEADLVEAMNVADDAIVPDMDLRSTRKRAERELDLLRSIRDFGLEPRLRCEFLWRILRADRVDALANDLEQARSA